MENDLEKLTKEQALRNRLVPMMLDEDLEKTKKRINELVLFILNGK